MTLVVKTAVGPTILLQSGNYFDFQDPAASRFTMRDIAQGLGNACRFAGQCSTFYSVAEHSYHASFLVPGNLQFAALMHDAAEAFIGDVTRPLKCLLPAYKVIENGIEKVIDERFALGGLASHPIIKHADMQMLAAEQRAMMPSHDDEWPHLAGIEIPEIRFMNWLPDEATRKWLQRAADLLVPAIFNTDSLERL